MATGLALSEGLGEIRLTPSKTLSPDRRRRRSPRVSLFTRTLGLSAGTVGTCSGIRIQPVLRFVGRVFDPVDLGLGGLHAEGLLLQPAIRELACVVASFWPIISSRSRAQSMEYAIALGSRREGRRNPGQRV